MERKVFFLLGVLFGLVVLIGHCNRTEAITREEFKVHLTAMYEKMEELAKADGCTEIQRYWTNAPEGRGVFLWVECVKSKQHYWLSTPDAHQKVQNAQ